MIAARLAARAKGRAHSSAHNRHLSRLWASALAAAGAYALLGSGPALADASLEEMLAAQHGAVVRVTAGETVTLFDSGFEAREDSIVYFSLSSDYLAAAVLSGDIASADHLEGGPGRVLVLPLDGRRTERFQFDAAQLRRTLSAQALGDDVASALDAIERRQRRARFFGLLEPVGVNAAAAAPAVEPLRRSYLNEPLLVRLRRGAHGDTSALSQATAQAFVSALGSGAVDDVATLVDPGPFLAQTTDAVAWRSARSAFARRLAAQSNLATDLNGASIAPAGDPARVIVTGRSGRSYAVSLVARDRALFVAALEETSP